MSIQITFPDGNVKSYDAPPTGLSIAQGISPGLAKKAALIKLDGELYDLTRPIERSAAIEIVTRDKPEVLDVIRHDAAHVLAQAVQELFPGTQITFGPSTDVGFYYDFARSEPFSESDLEMIEARMRDIVKRDLPITREVWPREQVIEFFEKSGEKFKAEWVSEGIAAGEEISIYRQGQDWLDMCRGPHLASTAKLGSAFKLTKVSGAYWRGDANNAQLQRIYGVAFATDDELKAYLKMVEEAEKRDHRKLAKQLDLFHQQEEAPGMVFWHPKGWAIWQAVEQYVRGVYRKSGYQEVRGPQIMDVSLWKRSGHWDNYQENMFFTESEKRTYAVKPMNCPGHVQIYNAGLRSYRDLPIRYGEFGGCHRNEPSGGLHGIMRVRAFTQDDGHIFCTEDMIQAEVAAFTTLLQKVYKDFGFTEILYKLSTRPEKRIGSEESWDKAEAALAQGLRASGCEFEYLPGEGAFYGPKIEYTLKDALGRQWQCGTMQVDPNMPERLDAEYVAEDGSRQRPIMLHRAIVGSLERFIGILIEQHAGALPTWLAPVQVAVLNITDAQADYCREIAKSLQNQGLRVETDLRNEKITYKIREHALQKLPFIAVVGDKEKAAGAVAVRARGNKDLGVMSLEAFSQLVATSVSSKA